MTVWGMGVLYFLLLEQYSDEKVAEWGPGAPE
jgi:hypothetical protein